MLNHNFVIVGALIGAAGACAYLWDTCKGKVKPIFSVAGLILWLITKVGNVAIFFSIVADGLAALPTLVKAYKHPETEIAWPWMATCIGVVLTLLTVKEWTFANSGFIGYIFIVDLMIFACVQFKLGKRA